MPLAGFTEHFLSTFPDLVGRRVLVALSGGPDSVALLVKRSGLDPIAIQALPNDHPELGQMLTDISLPVWLSFRAAEMVGRGSLLSVVARPAA